MPIGMLFLGLTKTDVEGSIYEYIEKKIGIENSRVGIERFLYRKATDFLKQMNWLWSTETQLGLLNRSGYLNTGVQFEYSISVHRYDQF